MAFDYSKFLSENELTTTSRIKARFLKEEEEEDTYVPDREAGEFDPTDSINGMRSVPKEGKDTAVHKQSRAGGELPALIKKKNEILAKYKSGELSLDQYRTQIGNIPQKIKSLQATADSSMDIDSEEAPDRAQGEFDKTDSR